MQQPAGGSPPGAGNFNQNTYSTLPPESGKAQIYPPVEPERVAYGTPMPQGAPIRVQYVTGQPVQYQVVEGIVVLPRDVMRTPVVMYCPYDQQEVQTMVERRPGLLACLCSLILCCTFWPCFFLPFCTPSCFDKVHRCPRCGHVLAVVPA